MNEIIGSKVVDVRHMTKKEAKAEGWEKGGTALVLDNGIVLYASQDEEGNGPGALFGSESGEQFMVDPEE